MPSNVIAALRRDHRRIQRLLEDLSRTTERAEKKRIDLVRRIEKELLVHTTLEEELLYPLLRADQQVYHDAKEEHRAIIELLLADLRRSDPSSPHFGGRVHVLNELTSLHMAREEDVTFPRIEASLEAAAMARLDRDMKRRRKNLLAPNSSEIESKRARLGCLISDWASRDSMMGLPLGSRPGAGLTGA